MLPITHKPQVSAQTNPTTSAFWPADYDYMGWIAYITTHIPGRGTQLFHCYGANLIALQGITRRRGVFVWVTGKKRRHFALI